MAEFGNNRKYKRKEKYIDKVYTKKKFEEILLVDKLLHETRIRNHGENLEIK